MLCNDIAGSNFCQTTLKLSFCVVVAHGLADPQAVRAPYPRPSSGPE